MTSANAPKTPDNQAEYLQRQAEEAKAAIAATMKSAVAGLGPCADPRIWARSYPISSLLVAAIAGFAASSLAFPSANQQQGPRERLQKPPSAAAESAEYAEQKSNAGSAWLGPIVKELLSLAKPVLSGILARYVPREASDGKSASTGDGSN